MANKASTRSHLDERMGRVAIDMAFLDHTQVEEIRLRVMMTRSDSDPDADFGEMAVSQGFITREQLELLRQEEKRRRRLINGYEIVENLGTGTIATVYRARQIAMDRDVALKILHPRLASDPVFVRAYIAEAQAVSRFHHPNIVQGFDSGQSNGFYFFAHEYLSGGSLADRLEKLRTGEERFSENRLLVYLRQTTAALKHAWTVAVYHGDINPGNLLLDGQGNIKLANLGVPRVAKPRRTAGDAGGGRDESTGLRFIRCGPEYAAPEQIDAPETVNARTDIYNLGATFYHLSFGVPPFTGHDRKTILEYRQKNPIPIFSLKSQEAYSGKYLRLIHDMLEVDPEKRPADPEELASRLENFHIAGVDELSGLARQVRQVAAPSARMTSRGSDSPAPAANGFGRKFSLTRRPGSGTPGFFGFWTWLIAGFVAAAVVAILFVL